MKVVKNLRSYPKQLTDCAHKGRNRKQTEIDTNALNLKLKLKFKMLSFSLNFMSML